MYGYDQNMGAQQQYTATTMQPPPQGQQMPGAGGYGQQPLYPEP
ncbi:SseB family protein, partial [Streptomyces sp. GC420]|nr:SseB family protein [Streptomyces sp. GC420]